MIMVDVTEDTVGVVATDILPVDMDIMTIVDATIPTVIIIMHRGIEKQKGEIRWIDPHNLTGDADIFRDIPDTGTAPALR
jgi:hypothetical protein